MVTNCSMVSPVVDVDDDGTFLVAWDCPAEPVCAFCWTVVPLSTSSSPRAPF